MGSYQQLVEKMLGVKSAAPAATETPKIKPFNEIAAGLDPMMPAEDYDFLRQKYFDNFIKPFVPKGYSPQTTWEDFKKNTERPGLLNKEHKALIPIGLGMVSAVKGAVEPFIKMQPRIPGNEKKFLENLDNTQKMLTTMARREGMSTLPGPIGEMVGASIPLMAAFEGAEPLAGGLAAEFASTARGIELAHRLTRGGVAFAAYEAALADNGHRTLAGVKGAAIGATLETGFSLPGLLRGKGVKAGEVEKVIQDVLTGKQASPEIEQTLAKKFMEDAQVSKQEMRPMGITSDPKVGRGKLNVQVDMKGRVVPFTVTSGKEGQAVYDIKKLVDEGGSVQSIFYHPEEVGLLNQFLKLTESISSPKYEATKRVITAPGSANQVAAEMQLEGIPAEPISDSVVHVHTKPALAPNESVVAKRIESLKDEKGFTLSKGAQDQIRRRVMALWDVRTPDVTKEHIAEMIKSNGVDELIPPQYVREKALPPPTAPTVEEASAFNKLVEQFGRGDPEKVDVELLREVGHVEVLRAMEVAESIKRTGVKAPGVIEEAIRKGELDIQSAAKSLDARIEREASPEVPGRLSEGVWITPRGSYLSGRTHVEVAQRFLGKEKGISDFLGMGPVRIGAGQGEVAVTATRSLTPEQVKSVIRFYEKASKERAEFYGRPTSLFYDVPGGRGSGSLVDFIKAAQQGNKAFAARSLTIPPNENRVWSPGGKVDDFSPRKVTERPLYSSLKLTPEELAHIEPTAAALVERGGRYREILAQLGYNVEGLPEINKPLMVYTSMEKGTLFHEGLHINIQNAIGEEAERFGSIINKELFEENPQAFKTAQEIANGLGIVPAYSKMARNGRLEEAFVHAAQAVRVGDMSKMAELIAIDTSAKHILEMVNGVSEKLFEVAGKTDSVNSRILSRKMEDLIRRTSDNRIYDFQHAYKTHIGNVRYNPETNTWLYTDSLGRTAEGSLEDYYTSMSEQTGLDLAPSSSGWAEARGVKGPFGPRGTEPNGSSSMNNITPDKKWKGAGLLGLSSLFRVTGPWVSSAQKIVDRELGEGKFPLFDKWKAADEGYKASISWSDQQYETAANLFKGDPKKLQSLFELMTYEPKQWEQVAKGLNLTKEDLTKGVEVRKWLEDFKNSTNIPVFNYLLEDYPKLRGGNFSTEFAYGRGAKKVEEMSFFHRAIVEGDLHPEDNHVGRFADFLIRAGREKKFTGAALDDLKKSIESKNPDGSYVLPVGIRKPLTNYHSYMKGIPDITQQVMLKATSDFSRIFTERAVQLNKGLPSWAQLPTEFNYPGSMLNKLMLWSYASGIGGRPSIPIRDVYQAVSNSLPIVGPSQFASGAARAATREGIDLVEKHGGFLNKINIGMMYPDIFQEIPAGASQDWITKFSNKLLWPSRAGHNVPRAITFIGEFDSAMEAISKLRAGSITTDQFIRKPNTNLWWADKPAMSRLVRMASDSSLPADEVAGKIANELLDNTLWPYRRGTQPLLLRTGVGRIFGQYGLWPLNEMEFLRRMATKFPEYPKETLQAVGTWTASNYAAVASLEALGVDSYKWFFISPAGFGGSPHAQFVHDLFISAEETDEGRAARRRVLEYPVQFLPTGNELRNVIKAVDEGGPMFDSEGMPTPNFLRVLGFKPLKEKPDEDFEQFVSHELGYGVRRAQH
jgi:hypothetical protein